MFPAKVVHIIRLEGYNVLYMIAGGSTCISLYLPSFTLIGLILIGNFLSRCYRQL